MTRSQKIRLGAFAVATAALLVAVLVVFAGIRFWEEEEKYVVEYSGSVLGLANGSEVMLNGVRVGTVDSVAISPDDISRVRVTIAVAEGTPVRADTQAMLVMRGITGLRVIDLRGGTPGAPAIPPGSEIPSGQTGMDQLVEKADRIADRTLRVMDTAERALENAARVGSEVEVMVSENRALVRSSLLAVAGAARNASRLMDRELREMVAGANALVADVSGVVRENQAQLRAALLDLRRASGSFKELARDLRQRPSRLLFSRPPKDRELP